jgi:ApaG protein
MVQLLTNGIKISVKTTYNGVLEEGLDQYNAFSYYISIENETKDEVQLLERFWEIFDALNGKKQVEGEGVVGQRPIIAPKECYTYTSNCFLLAAAGSMKGSFMMVNKNTLEYFKVIVPAFQLTATPLLN